MLYDLQDRKFQAREISDEDEPVADVRKIEHYLYRYRCNNLFLLIYISKNTDLYNSTFVKIIITEVSYLQILQALFLFLMRT